MNFRCLFLLVLLVAVSILALFVGPVDVTPLDLLRATPESRESGLAMEIVLRQRLPRILLAVVTGGALAVVGAAFQGLLGNPLATPYTLGLSGGGALGAVIAIWAPGVVGAWGAPPLSLAGALMAASIVYLLTTRQRGLRGEPLILAGVIVGFFCSAMVLLVRYLASPRQVVLMDRWMMGGLEQVGFGQIAMILPYVFAGLTVIISLHRELDQLAFGSALATGRGVNVPKLRRNIFVAGSLSTAAVVSVAGPIAFIGLMVPHVLRRLIGFSHGRLLCASFLLGGAFLVACDAVARTILAPSEIPVGVITAGFGGPFFLVLLLRRK